MRTAIVVPSIRAEHIMLFLNSWKKEFEGHTIIVVEDNPERTFDLSNTVVQHYSWTEIDAELGRDSWIIPRRTDCIRSFGFYKAFVDGADVIISLDDDCTAVKTGFVTQHHQALNAPVQLKAWTSTINGAVPRGMPYFATERTLNCILNHGLWTNVPDFDAITQLGSTRQVSSATPIEQVIPVSHYFPMCGMNVAFKRDLASVMYFLLMGNNWPYDRFGDIWCGVIAKKICDHLGFAIRSGSPLVNHLRASNVWDNLRKEVPGYQANETIWTAIDSIRLTGRSFSECYKQIAESESLSGQYWDTARRAMRIWNDLFTSDAHGDNDLLDVNGDGVRVDESVLAV